MNYNIKSLLVIVSLIPATGCRQPSPAESANQSQVAEMKEKWKSKAEAFRDSKDFRTWQVTTLSDLLINAPTNVVESECGRVLSGKLPDWDWDALDVAENYDCVLLEALIDLAVRKKDGARLGQLLAQNCPGSIGIVPLEYWLVQSWPDAILLLADAHGKAKSASVRTDVVHCLGRAFPSLRNRFPKDAEFVSEVQAWYKANRTQLRLNHGYPYLASLSRWAHGAEGKDLFLLRK